MVRQSASKGEFVSVSEAVGAELVWGGDLPATLVEAIVSLRTPSPTTPGDPATAIRDLDLAIADGSDQIAAISAVHALADLPGEEPGERLAALLYQERPFLREHAAWTLGRGRWFRRPCRAWSTWSSTVASQAPSLRPRWSRSPRRSQGWCATRWSPRRRTRRSKVRGVGWSRRSGWYPGWSPRAYSSSSPPTNASRRRRGQPPWPPSATRRTPSTAQVHAVLDAVAGSDGALAAVARLARSDLDHAPVSRWSVGSTAGADGGQLFLHADIDGDLRRAGQGDTGGIATLLVHLGDALLADRRPRAAGGHDLAVGGAGDDQGLERSHRPGHHYLPVPFWGPSVPAAEAWPLRVATRRAMRRILDQAQVDVLHLRMADVGSWAAAEAARDLGVPVVVTLAPDPHASVAVREADGVLTRQNVGRVDEVEHLVFRILLLRQLQQQASQLVVFPRPALEANLRDLLGVDVARERARVTVVPEGIDPVAARPCGPPGPGRCREGEYASAATLDALDDLDDLLDHACRADRRELPLAVTVGRLHPVKGMATLVQAWSGHAELRAAVQPRWSSVATS